MIPNDITRCQGRTMSTSMGSTLAEECTDCARRTCIEPNESYSWMTPPAITWSRVCGSWLPDSIEFIELMGGV